MEQSHGTQHRGSRLPIGWILAASVVLAALLAVPATAQNTTQITLEAREDCADSTFCFAMTGSVDDLEPGDVLDITLESSADNLQEHNVHLALSSEANVGEEEATQPRVAFADSEDISPGNETSFSAEIPEDAESLYLWCTIRAHEQQGMWEEIELSGVEDEEENGSPAPGALASLAAISGLALVLRRR